MKKPLMMRETCTLPIALLALFVALVGCSTSSTSSEQRAPNEQLDYSMWDAFTRAPSAVKNDDADPEIANLQSHVVNLGKVRKTKTFAPAAATVTAKACGDLSQGESSHTALNSEDTSYFLDVDCKSLNKGADIHTLVRFADGSTVPQQRSYLTRWRRKAAFDHQSSPEARSALPYICFTGKVSNALCAGSETSTVKVVDHFTSRVDVYKAW